MALSPDPFSLDTPLFMLTETDAFTIRDACEGVQVFGAIGSGKTSGSGAALARAFLENGFGMLVCCAKPEERRLWEDYARKAGRLDDVRIVAPGERCGFNFLRYELEREGPGGGQTENLVNLLSVVTEIAEGGNTGDRDKYWERAARQMLRNAIDTLSLADKPITLDTLQELIADAPTSVAQVHNTEWQNKPDGLYQTLLEAKRRTKSGPRREKHDFETAARYWLNQFASFDDRPRSSIVSTFTSMADLLSHGLAWELMGSTIELIPEATFEGRIIILDLPLQEYGEVGRVIQGIWKTMFQRAVVRRDVREHPRPVGLWCDESQNFLSSFDYQYQAVARSARACTVYLTQNLPNYRARLGAGAHDAALALLGNFQTKIWHANGDYVTNTYAADTIGQRIVRLESSSTGGGEQGVQFSMGDSEQVQYIVPPHEFARFKKGGPQNGYEVQGVLYQAGRLFDATGEPFLRMIFTQERDT